MQQKFIKSLCISFIIILISFSTSYSENLKSIGKFKDWETFTVTENNNKVCFAQSASANQRRRLGRPPRPRRGRGR